MRISRLDGRTVGLTMAILWLAFLAFPLAATLGAHPPAAELAATLAGAALFVAVYIRLVLNRTRPFPDAPGIAYVVLLLALATALTIGSEVSWATLFIFAAAASGSLLREPLAIASVALCALLSAISAIAAGAEAGTTIAFASSAAGIGMLILSIAGLRARNAELHRARGELARLAVADERLRFARDLHDLLGHSLSVIALKAELAGRLLDVDTDAGAGDAATVARGGEHTAAARMHIGELEGVARGALSEVREAVSGYRRPVLAAELDGARMALEAAGIEARLDRATGTLAPEVEALLAWTVREGTINAIRHSGARRCRVAIAVGAEGVSIEVIDDGQGLADAGVPVSGAVANNAVGGLAEYAGAGHGLVGLRERAEDLAGTMEVGSAPDGGFRLRVSVPPHARAAGTAAA